MVFFLLVLTTMLSGCLNWNTGYDTYQFLSIHSLIMLEPQNGTFNNNDTNINQLINELQSKNASLSPDTKPPQLLIRFTFPNISQNGSRIDGVIRLNATRIQIDSDYFLAYDSIGVKGDKNSSEYKKVDTRLKNKLKTYNSLVIEAISKVYETKTVTDIYKEEVKGAKAG